MTTRSRFWVLALSLGLLLPAGLAWAQRDRDRDAPQASEDEGNRVQIPRPDREDERGSEEGMPESSKLSPRVQIPPGGPDRWRQGWRLGVYAVNTESGVRITEVAPGSPAQRNGLEPRDVIVTVNGYQIGYVGDRFYPLGEELQRRAGANGEVTLLVQDTRTGRLLNLPVQLERRGPIGVPR